MKLKIGLGKQDMTAFIPGLGMMGYGQIHNTVKEVATPLMARVLFIHEPKKFILVHLEQCFVTIAIKEEVLKQLQTNFPDWQIGYENLVITAQHTHSAPGGYSHYPFYNFTIPGFQTRVFSIVTTAIVDAIKEASTTKESVEISWGRTTIHTDKEIAFNRSMKAQALNPEAIHFKEDEKHLAVDRTMEGMFLKNDEGKLLAFINWFAVHNTSISSFNNRIHHDNKGVAADLFEKAHPGVTAFFLQSAAGDVSPNFIWDKKKKIMRGKFSDHYENAAFNGELQFQESQIIRGHNKINGKMNYKHLFLDMALEVAAPAHGVGFFEGTAEGPGLNSKLSSVLKLLSKTIKKYQLFNDPQNNEAFYAAHGNKDIVLDHRKGAFIGVPLSIWKKLPPLPDPTVEAFRKAAKNNSLETLPWVPSILPFQYLTLGDVLIAFVPGEISVTAGRRLKLHLLKLLKSQDIKEIFLTSYANAYMGYIVTPEEYDKQCYEGGHTVYGRSTLQGIMNGFTYLIQDFSEKSSPGPFKFPQDELLRRSI